MNFRIETWIIEACILAVLEHEDKYVYSIIKNSELLIAESTSYSVIRRLTEKGCLKANSQINNSRLRKYYSITPKGRKQLLASRAAWKTYKERISDLLEDI